MKSDPEPNVNQDLHRKEENQYAYALKRVKTPSLKKPLPNLTKPLSDIFEKLQVNGLMKPKEPKPLSQNLPPHYDYKAYYDYYQQTGHITN